MGKDNIYPISRVDPKDTKIELNCRTVKSALLYIEEKYGREELERFVYDTGMNLDYIENRNNWISYEYFRKLLSKLVEYTGDPKTPFIAGTYSGKKVSYGALESFFTRLGSPAATYKLMAEFSPRVTKLGGFTIVDLKKNYCTVSSYYFKGYPQDKNNCLNFQGILAAVPTMWGLPLAKIKEIHCAAEGADTCVYEVFWRNRPSHLYGLLGLSIGCALLYVSSVFKGLTVDTIAVIAIPIMGYLIGRIIDYKATMKEINYINEKESRGLLESVEIIEKLNMDLQQKVEQRTVELKNTLDELRKSQGQLVQSEKMASVGRLAAGMAHELNNPVGAVRNYIQDVLEDISPDNPCWERLKRAEKATGRCKRIVNDLLSFAAQTLELKSVDINDIVKAAVSNAREEIGDPDIRIIEELSPGLPRIDIDPLQIQQVFMNILMNAGDAIKGEGRIIVKTFGQPGKVLVEISDTGIGILEENLNRIFDPFFTTKASGKGTGLGLAISYNIVKRFYGDIHVKSQRDKGAAFTVILPAHDMTEGAVTEYKAK